MYRRTRSQFGNRRAVAASRARRRAHALSPGLELADLLWAVVRAAELVARRKDWPTFRNGQVFMRRASRLENALARLHNYWNPDGRV